MAQHLIYSCHKSAGDKEQSAGSRSQTKSRDVLLGGSGVVTASRFSPLSHPSLLAVLRVPDWRRRQAPAHQALRELRGQGIKRTQALHHGLNKIKKRAMEFEAEIFFFMSFDAMSGATERYVC